MENGTSIQHRYDEVSPTYAAQSPENQVMTLYHEVYDYLTMRGVESVLPKDGRSLSILDAGGGGGKFAVWLAKLGHRVTVLDISPGMLAQAKARFDSNGVSAEQFVVGDVLALPFPERSFDLVLCEGDPVSYCLERHRDAIAELVRVARPLAPVIMGVDNRYAHFLNTLHGETPRLALGILRNGRSECPYGLPVHCFTLHELRDAASKAGAIVDEIFGKPVLFFDVLRALRAERGEELPPNALRDEMLALQETLAHSGFAAFGGHFQVMAHRPAD